MPVGGGNTPQGPAGPCPAFCGGAAAGRAQQPGRVFAGQGAAPLRRLRRHLPLQGRLPGRQRTKRLPCKGSWMRRKAQTEGCIAGWRRKYPLKSGRVLPDVFAGCVAAGRAQQPGRVFAGQGAAPLRRLRRHLPLQGRLLGYAAARCSQFCRPCALYCRAGVHARQGRGCSGGGRVGLMQRLAPQRTGGSAMPRGGRDRPPYIAAESGQRPVNSSRLQRPTAGGGRESVVTGKGSFPVFCRVYGGREDAATRQDIA